MAPKLKIGIVGMGNVGIHFLQRLIELGHTRLTVYSRSGNNSPMILRNSLILTLYFVR